GTRVRQVVPGRVGPARLRGSLDALARRLRREEPLPRGAAACLHSRPEPAACTRRSWKGAGLGHYGRGAGRRRRRGRALAAAASPLAGPPRRTPVPLGGVPQVAASAGQSGRNAAGAGRNAARAGRPSGSRGAEAPAAIGTSARTVPAHSRFSGPGRGNG